MQPDEAIVADFVIEAKEHLADVEADLVALEEQGEAAGGGVVDRIFRAVHSIKGAAGFLGLHTIGHLAHAGETLLATIRAGRLAPTPEIIDLLLQSSDRLLALLDRVHESNEQDVSSLVEALHHYDPDAGKADADASPTAPLVGEPVYTPIPPFPLSEASRSARPPEHDHLYLLRYDLEEEWNRGRGAATILADLATTGIALEGRFADAHGPIEEPSASEGPLYFDILFSTVMEPDMVALATGIPTDRIVAAGSPATPEEPAPPAPSADEPPASPAASAPPSQGDASMHADEATPAPPDPPAAPTRREDPEGTSAGGSDTRILAGGTTIRLNVELVDRLMNLAGELVLVRNQHLQRTDPSDAEMRGIGQRLNAVTSEIQETIMLTRMQPIGNVINKFPRVVRDLARKLDKTIEIQIGGAEVELDKTILENLSDPLTHLVRNCCDHGIEPPERREAAGKSPSGHISLRAFHEAGHILVEIRDDGRGIDVDAVRARALQNGLRTQAQLDEMSDKDAVKLILLPGFSTAREVTDVSGRGVGMDVVKSSIEKLGGSMDIDSRPGKGTTVLLRLPLTLAIIPCLIVTVGEDRFAIPQVNIEEIVALYDDDVRTGIEQAHDQEVYRLRDTLLPLVRMREVLARPRPFDRAARLAIVDAYQGPDAAPPPAELHLAVVKVGSERCGLIVDSIEGTEEIVVKPLHNALQALGVFAGGTIMGDGRVALILDVEGVARHAGVTFEKGEDGLEESGAGAEEETQTVLLFRYGPQEQFAMALPMVRRIETIRPADIERIGDKEFVTIDGASTFVLRLDRVLPVSPAPEREEMFLLIPRHMRRAVGMLVSDIIDTAQTAPQLQEGGYAEDGLLGSAIVRNHMTLFPDIYRLLEKAAPDWFRTDGVHDGQRRRVLLVEDTSFFRHLVQRYLEGAGYVVETAANGREGLDRLGRGSFDAVISDLQMPVMDGWEFAREVRRRAEGEELPLVALTALEGEADRKRALECGFDRCEVKLDRERFLHSLSEALSARVLASDG